MFGGVHLLSVSHSLTQAYQRNKERAINKQTASNDKSVGDLLLQLQQSRPARDKQQTNNGRVKSNYYKFNVVLCACVVTVKSNNKQTTNNKQQTTKSERVGDGEEQRREEDGGCKEDVTQREEVGGG